MLVPPTFISTENYTYKVVKISHFESLLFVGYQRTCYLTHSESLQP